jgi:hypothetical protein
MLGLFAPLAGSIRAMQMPLLEWAGFAVGFALLFTIKFLVIHRIPAHALSNIQAERERNPTGPCSRSALKTGVTSWAVIGAAGVAVAVGQYIRRRYGLSSGYVELASAAGLGCWISAYIVWHWLRVGGGAPNPSLERP